MSKRRVKQQNVSVIGLFKLDGMRKWMAFSYTRNVRAHAGVTLQKIKTNKLNQKQCLPRAFYYVCSLFHMPFLYVLSTTCSFVCFSNAFPIRFVQLFVLSNKRAVFKPLIFPAYSTNIVIVIFHKLPPLLSDIDHPFAAHGLPFVLFLPVLTSGHP